nr:MAG TPA: minor tail protein [Caudoviricetes sp.]
MADGAIILDTRINNKGAYAELKELQAKAKSTAQQVAALDKQINTANSKHLALGKELSDAQSKAESTAAELESVNEQLDSFVKRRAEIEKQRDSSLTPEAANLKAQEFVGQHFASDAAKASELQGALDKLQQSIPGLTAKYTEQESALAGLQDQHAALAAQLATEEQAVTRQSSLAQYLNGEDSMQAYFNKQAVDIEKSFAKIEERQNKAYGSLDETATQHAELIVAETQKSVTAQNKAAQAAEQRAVREQAAAEESDLPQTGTQNQTRAAAPSFWITASQGLQAAGKTTVAVLQKPFKNIQTRLAAMTKSMGRFSRRIAGLASSALIFNLLSSGLRQMTSYMGTALLSSASLRQALGNLQGAAATAAAPLIQVLTPALTALANAAATVFAYLAKLVAFLTGKTVSSAKAAAKGMSGTSKAAKDAAKSLAGFDEIERLDAKTGSSGGSSGASSITPNYNFDAKSPFLDSVLAAIEAGEWNQVGQLFAQKLNEAMAAIPWPDIQDKAQTWAANIADTLNGFIARLDWRLVGSTLAQGLNTALILADTLVQGIHWDTLGNGIGNGMNQCVEELDWEALGRLMIAKWKILFETLHGFIQTFDFGALGDAFARATMAAINNIDWPQAAADLVSGAAGLIEALAHWIDGLDWQQIGSTIAECITNIDYAELAQAILDLLSAAVTGLADGLSALAGHLVGDFIQGVKQWFDDVQTQAAVAGYGDDVAGYLIDGFKEGLKNLLSDIGQWIYDHIFTPFKNGICEAFGIHSPSTEAKSWGSYISQGLLDGLASKWENITGWLRDLKQNFVDAWDNIRAKTSEAFNSIGQTISDIWNGIGETIKTAVNGIIGFINRMISAVVTGINAVINALNGLSFDLPDIFGGGHVGFNISTLTAPQIPYLAQGAVIPANREFLAVLGDQRSGTNVEAPLDTIKQAVAEVMEDLQAGQMAGFEAVVSVLREILSAVYGIELTDEDVGRAVQRWQRKQLIATGGV